VPKTSSSGPETKAFTVLKVDILQGEREEARKPGKGPEYGQHQ
jgi:hypothetical protein